MNIINISEDDKTFCLEELKSFHQSLSFLLEQLDNNDLQDEFKDKVLGLNESYLKSISGKLNNKIKENINKRSIQSKTLQEKIKETTEKLLEKSSFENFNEKSKEILDIVDKFWRNEGFGYVNDTYINKHGEFHGEFNTTPDLDFLIFDNGIRKELKDFNDFILGKNESESNYLPILDCQENRIKLESILLNRFPSIDIREFMHFKIDNQYIIQRVKCVIRDLLDITNYESKGE